MAAVELTINSALNPLSELIYQYAPITDLLTAEITDLDGESLWDESVISRLPLGIAANLITNNTLNDQIVSSFGLSRARGLASLSGLNLILDISYVQSGEVITDLSSSEITDQLGFGIYDLSQIPLSKLFLSIVANLVSNNALNNIISDDISLQYELHLANALGIILSDSFPLVPIINLVATNAIQNVITDSITTMTFTKSLSMSGGLSELIDQLHTQIVYNLQPANTLQTLQDQIALVVAALVLPASLVHTLPTDNPFLSGLRNLLANTAIQTQTSDSLNLGASFAMSISSALQILTSDQAQFALAYRLPINSALQLQIADTFALIEYIYIFIADALNQLPTDSPSPVRASSLLSNIAVQNILSTDAYIAAASGLVLGDALNRQTAENIIIGFARLLGINDSINTQTAEQLVLSMLGSLNTNTVIQTMTSNEASVFFTQAAIIIASALQQQISGNIDIIGPWVIWADSGVSTQVIDQITISIRALLSLNNTNQLLTSENIRLLLEVWLKVLYFYLAKNEDYSFTAIDSTDSSFGTADDYEFIAHDGLK